MNFAGNKYVYLSKNKLSKANQLKTQKLSSIQEKNENESNIQIDPKLEEKEEREEINEMKEIDECLLDDLKNDLQVVPQKDKKKKKKKMLEIQEDRLSLSCESFQENELNHSYSNGSDEDDKDYKMKQATTKKEVGGKKIEKVVDTNILSLKFEFLKNKIPFATGDPHYCINCKAVLNSLSKIEEKEKIFIWKCEFCLAVNELLIEKEEIPKDLCIDFFVESYNQMNKSSYNYTDQQSLIYCFDISGSMCVTYPLDKKMKIKGSRLEAMYKEMMKWSDGSDQFYQETQKNISYVSRLQCLQGAIEENITSLLKNAPNLKVGFVTFNNQVMGYGDCLKPPITIEGKNLNNENYIMKIGEENKALITSPIKQTQKQLIKNLYSFEENGQTALGPAMLLSISLIDKAAVGSRIILCTDGIANLGLGSIIDSTKEENSAQAKVFFSKLGQMAKDKGIVISLITFQDEESQITVLLEMIEKTGGEIIRVNPKQIIDQFSNLLTNEIVATEVSIKIKLHKILSFRNEQPENITDNGCTLIKNIGNATKETELYVEYMFKKSAEIAQLTDVDINKLKEITFQSIIQYTTPSGDKCIRVITSAMAISDEKELVQKQSNFDIVSTNAVQKTALIAQTGDLKGAQAEAYAWKQFIKKNTQSNAQALISYSDYSDNMRHFHRDLTDIRSQMCSQKEVEKQLTSDHMTHQIYSMKNTSQARVERNSKKK